MTRNILVSLQQFRNKADAQKQEGMKKHLQVAIVDRLKSTGSI